MSIIDQSNHNVIPYLSGVTKPFNGQRLITVTYKTVTDKSSPLCNIKRDSKAVSVPVILDHEIKSNIDALIPHIRGMIEGVQKSIVRELLDAGSNVLSIAYEDINIASCIEYLESSDESGRLTKESVGNWFDSSIADMLTVALAEKLGVSDTPTTAESDKVLAIIAAFKRDISALAGGKTNYPATTAKQLKKALDLAPDGDVIAARFTARLDKMIAVPVNDLINAL